MQRAIVGGVAGLLLLGVSVAADAPGAIPRTGPFSARNVLSSAFKALPLGGEHLHVTYEGLGVSIADTGADVFLNASVRCLGALRAVNGSFDDESGSCVYTRPDGDQVFTTFKGQGRVGGEAKGTGAIVGGTGKLTGIRGSYEFVRIFLRPAEAGTTQSITHTKGTYTLP